MTWSHFINFYCLAKSCWNSLGLQWAEGICPSDQVLAWKRTACVCLPSTCFEKFCLLLVWSQYLPWKPQLGLRLRASSLMCFHGMYLSLIAKCSPSRSRVSLWTHNMKATFRGRYQNITLHQSPLEWSMEFSAYSVINTSFSYKCWPNIYIVKYLYLIVD